MMHTLLRRRFFRRVFKTCFSLVLNLFPGCLSLHAVATQPPLSFYTAVLNSQQWENVDIVTSARNKKELDPVVSVLQMLTDTGSWPLSKITITTVSGLLMHSQHDSKAIARSYYIKYKVVLRMVACCLTEE